MQGLRVRRVEGCGRFRFDLPTAAVIIFGMLFINQQLGSGTRTGTGSASTGTHALWQSNYADD